MALTEKQERFCKSFVETGNATLAYKTAFNCENMQPQTINKRASELLAKSQIKGRIDELREVASRRHNITVDSLIDELEEARKIALEAETPQASAAISATMGKAKLLGLDKIIEDKIEIKDKHKTIRIVRAVKDE